MNKQKLFLLVSFVVLVVILLLSYVEMNNCKDHALLAIDTKQLNDDPCLTITPAVIPMKHNVFIYNAVDESKHKTPPGYIKEDNYEHVASSIITPVHDIFHKIKQAKHSYSPINNMYGAITKATDVMSVVSLASSPNTKYFMEHHPDDDITAFLANDIIYVI